MSAENLKIGDYVKFSDIKDLTRSQLNLISIDGLYKIKKIDNGYISVKSHSSEEWYIWRFEKASVEEIVKAKLLGKYFD